MLRAELLHEARPEQHTAGLVEDAHEVEVDVTAAQGVEQLIATLADTGGHVLVADPLPLPATASSKVGFNLVPGEGAGTFTDLLDIGQLLDRRPGKLSGGERPRVALRRPKWMP